MKIEKIKKMKDDKYKIIFDNDEAIVTYDDVILKNNILYNKEIDIEKIHKENYYYDSYNKVVKYISKKIRSKYEIEKYLNKLECSDKQKIIEDLTSKGLINEKLFVDSYINDHFFLTNDGPIKIKSDLQNHNINEQLIDSSLSIITGNMIKTKIDKIVSKKMKTDHTHSLQMIKNKLMLDLINLGYPKELILDILTNYNEANDSIIKEYNKLLNKGLDAYVIKQKLYQKGYSLDEINNVMNK